MSKTWTNETAAELYKIDRWGCGFFGINDRGEVEVRGQSGSRISVLDVINKTITQHHLSPPMVIRFPHLIWQQIERINNAFLKSIRDHNYQGRYQAFFPAKVNQHHEVVVSAIEALRHFGGGVEAGSKAELFALLLMTDDGVPVLCNGFKDRQMTELAFAGMRLGRDVTIILEKPAELDLVLETAHRIGVRPKLGVRVKLSARSSGRWQNSGGAKSKFGFDLNQLLHAIDRLNQHGLIDCLKILHFHPGSQISSVEKVRHTMIEAARIYVELVKRNVPLSTIDIGGGLAIDYTGEENQDPFSRDYTLEQYASAVVGQIQQICQSANVPVPNIISESGRALAAHHSLLVLPIVENQISHEAVQNVARHQDESLINELSELWENASRENLLDSYRSAQKSIRSIRQQFAAAEIGLSQRATAEELFSAIVVKARKMLSNSDCERPELQLLKHQLADRYIGNFSVFQAIPDAWGLNQLFPIMPLHRLNEKPTNNAVIGDITCDSDGQIGRFIGQGAGKKSLPLHSLNESPYYLGVFLIGAYQEALSDDHNLMGNFHVVNVAEDGRLQIRKGASVIDVLTHVGHRESQLHSKLNSALSQSALGDAEKEQVSAIFESVREAYTYLQPKNHKLSGQLLGERETNLQSLKGSELTANVLNPLQKD